MAEDTQAQQPTPDPALRRLDRFVGTWRVQGHLVGSDETTVKVRQPSDGYRGDPSWNSACR